MSITVDESNRLVSMSLVKKTCLQILGRTISKEAWKRWKDWADISEDDDRVTICQFQNMVAIARLRSKNRNRELSTTQIKDAKTEKDALSISGLISSIDCGELVEGRKLLPKLREEFPDLKLSQVRAVVNGFDFNGWYDLFWVSYKLKSLKGAK